MNSLFTAGYAKGREHQRILILKDIRIEIYKAQIDGDQHAATILEELLKKIEEYGELASK